MIIPPGTFKPYENKVYKKTGWLSKNGIAIAISVIGLLAINMVLLAHTFQGERIDAEKADHFGSFVGGYFGSQFALLSVVLLYLTLRDQRHTNNIEKFEDKYFELIRLHRENVAEMGCNGESGRKEFAKMIQEFRTALPIVRKAAQATNMNLDSHEYIVISYLVIFYGIGPDSTRQLKCRLSSWPADFIDLLLSALEREQEASNYITFSGQHSRLGQYYRHLYQTIRFVDLKNDIGIDKYEYVKTIRAQLTNHEQALLLLNSLTSLGADWWKDQLIVRYKLVKNLPNEFFDKQTELDQTSFFPPDYFGWQENDCVNNPG